MNCIVCKINKISPESAPHGGYMCSEGHMQCHVCNDRCDGRCGFCKNVTQFVQMSIKPPIVAQTSSLLSAGEERETPTTFQTSTILEEIQSQSNISQEHMSMIDSNAEGLEQESVHQNKKSEKDSNLKKQESSEKHPRELNQTSNETNKLLNGSLNSNRLTLDTSQNLHCSISQSYQSSSNPISRDGVSKDSAFVFHDDTEYNNIIRTSEIRFVDSSDSLKCLLQDEAQKETWNLDHKELSKTRPHHAEGEDSLNTLSANVLGEMNNRRPQQYGNDIVENYLRTFGPMVYYHFPNYNCPHQQCVFSRNLTEIQDQQQQQLPTISEKKSISVSTDSEPNLQSTTTHRDAAKVENDGKPMPTTERKDQEYLVMHSIGVGQLQAGYTVDKFGRPSLDFKMQQILETLRENSINQGSSEKPEIIKDHLKKLPLTGVEGSAQILPQHEIPNLPMSILTKGYDGLAYIEPPSESFHMPTFSPEPAKDIGSIKSPRSPPSAKILNIPRLPLQCPESKCGRMLFISDFIRHLAVDHTNLLMERISSSQRKRCCLDPHLLQCDSNKCRLLYLLRDAIVDLGNSEYKDYLPVLLMTSRVSFKEMCGEMKKDQSAERDQHNLEKCLIVWITGLLPENHSISVSLDLRPIMDDQGHSCYIQYSGDMYSIRNSQNVVDVWKSGQMLLLSAAQVAQLTNGGKDMMEIQVEIH